MYFLILNSRSLGMAKRTWHQVVFPFLPSESLINSLYARWDLYGRGVCCVMVGTLYPVSPGWCCWRYFPSLHFSHDETHLSLEDSGGPVTEQLLKETSTGLLSSTEMVRSPCWPSFRRETSTFLFLTSHLTLGWSAFNHYANHLCRGINLRFQKSDESART